MASGKALRVLHPGLRLEPFKPATDLPPSTADGSEAFDLLGLASLLVRKLDQVTAA
jgi:hypothetical protein